MRIVPALPLIFAVFVLFLVAMCFQAPAMAGTFNVSDAAGLRGALITAATNGQDDVIVLAAGTYATGGTPFTASNENKTLTIQGANGTTRSQVVLDGGGTSRVLDFGCAVTCGAITLQGLTVQNGNATGAGGDGGGVKTSPLLVISDVMFLGNRALGSGGAIYTIGVGAAVTNSTFSSNSAQWGGAIWGSGTVTNSNFSNNTASHAGGAIYGLGTVTNSTFSNNTAFGTGGGGAIEGGGGTLTVTNSTFSNNTASNGHGGVRDVYYAVAVTNSTFSSNSAQWGGAIWFGDSCCALGSLIIVNNTFSGNSAGVSGAAIYIYSTSSIINSVFYGHSTPAIYAQSAYNLYNNLIDTSTDVAGSLPLMTGNIAPGTTSPFVDAANGNFRLTAGSLAIHAGLDPNSITLANLLLGRDAAPIRQALLTDLQGNPRPTPGTAVDIGAYEFSPTAPICTLTATPASISAVGSSTLSASCSPAATSYVWTGGTCAGTSGASCTVMPSVTTTYTVAGINSAGTGAAASATVTVTDTQSPTVPTGLSATAVSPSQINLAWTASTDNVGVTAYKVYRGGVLIATLGNVTSYSDTGLTASTTYSYTVQACDAVGNCSAQSAAATATTLTCTYSLFPTSQSVAANATTGTLSVTAASGCAWIASSNVAWITISSGSSGSGNGTVVYAVAANTNGSPRTGTLTIAGQTLTVTQAGITVPILGLQYYPLPRPIRLLDTRPGETAACNNPGTPLTGGTPLPLLARGACQGVTIPANAQAVVGNSAVVNFISGPGYITLYPSGAAQPLVANLNYNANDIVSNAFTVGLGSDGKFNIFASTTTHFIVDITGYYAPPGPGGLYYHPLPYPVRRLDTRAGETTACTNPGTPLTGGVPSNQLARGSCQGTPPVSGMPG